MSAEFVCATCDNDYAVHRMVHYYERSLCFGCNKTELEFTYPNHDWSEFVNKGYGEFSPREAVSLFGQ